MLAALLTSLLLLHSTDAAHLLKDFDDVVKVVHQVEATGHRLMVKIDGSASKEPFAAIAAHYNEYGWAFSKVAVKDVRNGKPVTFVHTQGAEIEEETDFFYVNEDFYKLERTIVGDKFKTCPEDNAEPFHFAEGSKKYYLATFKDGFNAADPKLIGVFVMDSGSTWSSLKGKVYAMGEDKALKKKVPTTLSPGNLEVFCRHRHGSDGSWKMQPATQ